MAISRTPFARALALGLSASLALAACGGNSPSGAAPSGPSGTGGGTSQAPSGPQKGGTAYVLLTTATANGDKFTDMDPQRIYIGEDMAFFGATIMRSLTQYKYSADLKEGTSLIADAATDTGTPSADAKSWTFTLRDGMKWQDGSDVKCEDFKYGASRAFAIDTIVNGPQYILTYLDIPLNDDGSSQYTGPYGPDGLGATPEQQALFDHAVVCDGNKITYNLSKPIADFNYTVTLGFGAVPNPVDHPGVDTGESYTTHPWSNGPYQLAGYFPGKGGSLTLERNPFWTTEQDAGYRGAYPDKWVVKLGLDPTVTDEVLMAPTGDDVYALQYGNIQPQNFQKIFTDPHTAAADFTGRAFSDFDPYSLYYWVNIDKVKNVKIRQAMAAALDRDAIRATSGGEFYGDFADGLIKPNIGQDYAETGWATDLFGEPIGPNGNVELAKRLIQESGEAAPTLTYDYGKSDPGDQRAAIVKSSLEAAGFTINLNPIESGYYAVIGDPALQNDFGASGWGPDWPNASTVIPALLTGATKFNNANDYSHVTVENSPDWYASIDAALSETDRAKQATMWQDLNKQAAEQVYIIPTVFSLSQVIAGTKVTTDQGLYKWPAYGSWPYAQIYLTQ
jgi:peptide/nickel transport system substrate-binding protein